MIPYYIIWYFAGILCAIVGFLLVKSGLNSLDRKIIQDLKAEIDKFKSKADKKSGFK
jgi:hypothetical protein